MAFQGRDPTRSKMVINSEIIEQVNTFNYLGDLILYEKKKDRQYNYKIFNDNRNMKIRTFWDVALYSLLGVV
jgi:hypothetical protein